MDKFRVLQANDRQRIRLRHYAERSYEKGLMDTLILFMTPGQLRKAHEDDTLATVTEMDRTSETEHPAKVLRPAAKIKPVE